MKKTFLICVVIAISLFQNSFAQDFSTLKGKLLEDSASCVEAESMVLECSNYLLSKPIKKELNSLYASDFIIEWLSKTQNYSFTIHEKFFKSIESDLNLSNRYYAALAKTAIESKTELSDNELQMKAISQLLVYCENKKNNVVISKKLQKFIDAKNDKTLEELLN